MRKQILILLGFSFSLIACQQNEEIGSVEDNANPNELTTRAASMRRVPTQAEKDNLKKDFPNLDVNNISVTGEATGTYNCIAYSMGITNKWIDPESFYMVRLVIMNRLVQKVAMLLLMVGEQVV